MFWFCGHFSNHLNTVLKQLVSHSTTTSSKLSIFLSSNRLLYFYFTSSSLGFKYLCNFSLYYLFFNEALVTTLQQKLKINPIGCNIRCHTMPLSFDILRSTRLCVFKKYAPFHLCYEPILYKMRQILTILIVSYPNTRDT